MLFNNMIKLLSEPVGNNLTNKPEDVENVKHQFRSLGRYNAPDTNGYIDRELNDTIFTFQKDRGLKVDGRMKPGGETEATLAGEMIGLTMPERDDDDNRKDGEYKTAMAAAAPAARVVIPPLFRKIAPMLGGGATINAAKDWWESRKKEEREGILEDVRQRQQEENGDDEECDKIHAANTKRCNDVTKRRGGEAGAICHKSASEINASCRAGKPEDDWPLLQD